ncbi:mandelate racemase/muconate lactonizing enzyme family protein [Halomarina litorea]|uniref:mandelate racemase/muconate lactonizing enzyme family protein n=1 Tax=Halomarina litorea TaxID=2961595 RepID=UPI0020C5248A|nr:o-succinylbenzoate synthase [Halomarina sp. BCD28]
MTAECDRVDLEPFSLRLARPLDTARGTIDHREGFLVRVACDGESGVGEATPLPGWTESLDDCEAALERATERAGSDGYEAALDALDARETPAARHGLSLALADARARATDEPLYRYLGGEAEVDAVPVNATVGDGDVETSVADAESAVDEGFDCLKVKVGARSLTADFDRVEAVREACPDATLRADANGSWDRETARRAMGQFGGHGVEYVEQPLPTGDLTGHADLRGGPVGVALDESLGEHGVDAVLAAGAADVLVLKPMALGGPDRARDAALRAREAGLEAVVTTTIDAVYARTAAVHVAASLAPLPACGLATADFLAEDLASDPAPVVHGAVTVPEGKGNVPAGGGSSSA